jgi:hypothetical protein
MGEGAELGNKQENKVDGKKKKLTASSQEKQVKSEGNKREMNGNV